MLFFKWVQLAARNSLALTPPFTAELHTSVCLELIWNKLRHIIYFYFWKPNCCGTSFQEKQTVQKPHWAAVCPAAIEFYGKYKYHLVKYLRVGNKCSSGLDWNISASITEHQILSLTAIDFFIQSWFLPIQRGGTACINIRNADYCFRKQ